MILLFASLAGFIAAPLGMIAGRRPVPVALLLALVPAGLFALFAGLAANAGATGPGGYAESVPWVPSLGIHLAFRLDGLSLLFALLVSGIGALIIVYTGRYASAAMAGRLVPLLLAFMAAMLGLVLADNLLLLVVFWSLTSLTSFLLIGLERDKYAAIAAARQALLVTVAGELALLGGVVLLGQMAGTYSITGVIAAGDVIRADPLFPAAFFLVLAGAITKSAQAPFHFWLPNAMAAPAPVSAYLHSATMVQAGIYLLARLHPLFGPSPLWGDVLVPLGMVTLLLGGLLALGARDLKQVLAYSTVGALGLMVMLLGVGDDIAIKAAMVFLLAHACYKAALFLIVGTVDHEAGERDPDLLGGLGRAMPLTAAAGVLAALSMAGLPPFLGFAGKELLYEASLPAALDGAVAPLLVTAGAFLGSVAFVTVAVVAGVRPFLGAPTEAARRVHGEPLLLWLPPLVLAVAGAAFGLLLGPTGAAIVGPAVEAVAGRPVKVDLALWHGITPMLVLSGITIAAGVAVFAGRAGAFPVLRRLDAGERFGPERGYRGALAGLQRLALGSSRLLQNGNLRHYLLTTLATVVVLVGAALIRAVPATLPAFVDEGVGVHEITVSAVVIVGALMAARAESRIAAITGLGASGYGIALLFLMFGAPDLALTQVLIETLTLILFVLVFYHLPGFLNVTRARVRIRDAGIAVAAGTVMGLLVVAGLADPPQVPISGYFTETAYPLARARNVVNAILVDFRALDTLGEIVVVALAALGVLALLHGPLRRRREQEA